MSFINLGLTVVKRLMKASEILNGDLSILPWKVRIWLSK